MPFATASGPATPSKKSEQAAGSAAFSAKPIARATERPASCASRPRASLTHRQTQAQNQFGDDYIVDYWGFSDVGKAGGAAVSPFGQFAVDEAYRRRE